MRHLPVLPIGVASPRFSVLSPFIILAWTSVPS